MRKKINVILCCLLLSVSLAVSAPSEYYVTVSEDGSQAYYFDISSGTMSTTTLSVSAFRAFGMPTFDVFATPTGTRYDGDKIYPEVSLIGKNGSVRRVFTDAIHYSFIHHPSEKIVFFFSGHISSDVTVAEAVNYYDYENDKLITVDIADVGFIMVNTYLEFNPNDKFLYWADDFGTVYKINTDDMKNVVTGTEGFVFSESGTNSAKYERGVGVKIYNQGVLEMTIPMAGLPIEYGTGISFHWYDDVFLIINIAGKCVSCNVKKETYTETIGIGGTYTYARSTKTFYRGILSKKAGCTLETIDASTCIQ